LKLIGLTVERTKPARECDLLFGFKVLCPQYQNAVGIKPCLPNTIKIRIDGFGYIKVVTSAPSTGLSRFIFIIALSFAFPCPAAVSNQRCCAPAAHEAQRMVRSRSHLTASAIR
jgi:hypothetical protein